MVVIRSHGVGREIYELLENTRALELVDATCPFVKKIHRIVREQRRSRTPRDYRRKLRTTRRSRVSKAGEMSTTLVVESLEQFENLAASDRMKSSVSCAQTTFNYKKFQDLVEKISKTCYDILVLNTICNATQERQVEARQIASRGGCYDCHRRKEQF